MPHFQTCRRHPEAGRFLAECSGCKRELFDMQARNEAEADARKALTIIGTDPAAVRILSVKRIGAALIVATEQPDAYFAYAVDTFRLPIEDETDPDQDDPREPGAWVLVDQYGDHGSDQVLQMIEDATAYLPHLGIAA